MRPNSWRSVWRIFLLNLLPLLGANASSHAQGYPSRTIQILAASLLAEASISSPGLPRSDCLRNSGKRLSSRRGRRHRDARDQSCRKEQPGWSHLAPSAGRARSLWSYFQDASVRSGPKLRMDRQYRVYPVFPDGFREIRLHVIAGPDCQSQDRPGKGQVRQRWPWIAASSRCRAAGPRDGHQAPACSVSWRGPAPDRFDRIGNRFRDLHPDTGARQHAIRHGSCVGGNDQSPIREVAGCCHGRASARYRAL